MNIGQIVAQMPLDTGLETAQPVVTDPMNGESQALQPSPFADVLRNLSPEGNPVQGGVPKAQHIAVSVAPESGLNPDQLIMALPNDVKLVFSMASADEKVVVPKSITPERIPEDTEKQQLLEVQNPQNVVTSVSGAQLVPLLQFEGRMPESQVADQHNVTTSDASQSTSNTAEAVALSGIEKLSAPITQQVAPSPRVTSVQTAEALPETAKVSTGTPAPATVAVSATPVPTGGNSDVRPTEAPAAPSLAAASPAVAPAAQANRAEPILDAYFQTSPRPVIVSASASDASSSAAPPPTVTAATPSSPPADISESTPSATPAPLVSSSAAILSAASAPKAAAAETTDPVISAAVTQQAAPSSVQTAEALPETAKVVQSTPAHAAAELRSETAPSSVAATVAVSATPAPSGGNSDVRPTEAPAAPSLAAASPAVAPAAQANRAEPVLDAYFQTSPRPVIVSASASDASSFATPTPTVTAAQSSPPAVTSESTPSATAAPLVSSPAAILTAASAPKAAAAETTEVAISAAITQQAAPSPRVTAIPTAEALPETVKVAQNAPASVTIAVSATQVPSGGNSDVRPTEAPAAPSLAAASPAVAPAAQANRAEPILDAYFQTSPRPVIVSTPAAEPVAAADASSSATPTPTVTAAQSSPPAVTSESTPSATAASLVSSPAPVLTAASAPTAAPAAAETTEPAILEPVTQQAAPSPRVTPASTRTMEKVVQEGSTSRQGAVSENRMPEQTAVVTSASVIEPATIDAGKNSSDNGNDGTERNLNAQAHLAALQQHRSEQPASITVPVREPSAAETMERVVQQVKEHLTSRDFKTGTEQVTIRLTPEHMGELKLNLRMENQQLKVEIVTENSMIRDTLLKHSDSLRETLAKQNISMESFDVSTSGNGGSSRRDQSDWRELAKQQLYDAAWMPMDGYRKADMPSNAALAYQTQTGHSMVDVHF